MIGLPVDRSQFTLVAVSSAPHPPPIHFQEVDLIRSLRSVGCAPWLQVLGVEAAVQGTAGPSPGGPRGGGPNKPASRLLILTGHFRPHNVTWPLPASNTTPPIAPHPSLTSSRLAFCSSTPNSQARPQRRPLPHPRPAPGRRVKLSPETLGSDVSPEHKVLWPCRRGYIFPLAGPVSRAELPSVPRDNAPLLCAVPGS